MVFLPCNISSVMGYNVQMTIVRARNLIAKDRHFLTRQRTTSDPYVEVFLGIDQKIGKTKTIQKSCDPEWNATFVFDIDSRKVGKEAVAGALFLKLYDEDLLTDHDLLGTMVIPIRATEEEFVETKWYSVDNIFAPRATGEVEITFQLKPIMGSASCFPVGGFWSALTPSPETVARSVVAIKNKIFPNNGTSKDDDRNAIQEDNKPTRRDYIVALIQAIYANNETQETAPRKKHSTDTNLFSEPLEGKIQQDTNQLEDWLMQVGRARGGDQKSLRFLLNG